MTLSSPRQSFTKHLTQWSETSLALWWCERSSNKQKQNNLGSAHWWLIWDVAEAKGRVYCRHGCVPAFQCSFLGVGWRVLQVILEVQWNFQMSVVWWKLRIRKVCQGLGVWEQSSLWWTNVFPRWQTQYMKWDISNLCDISCKCVFPELGPFTSDFRLSKETLPQVSQIQLLLTFHIWYLLPMRQP